MKCPQCQLENREPAIYCRNCGESLRSDITCPNCDVTNLPDSLFCEKCGQDLKPSKKTPSFDYSKPQSYTPKFLSDKILTSRSSIEGERKFVTVLFADVANSTAIFEKIDPEQVHQIMDGCFRIMMDEIHKQLMQCDLFISIGTSGVVYPAAGFAAEAKRLGAQLIEVNMAGTDLSAVFDEHIKGAATETVPHLVEQLIHLD